MIGMYEHLGSSFAGSVIELHIKTMHLIRDVLVREGGPPDEVNLVVYGNGYGRVWHTIYERLLHTAAPPTMMEATAEQLVRFRDVLDEYLHRQSQPDETGSRDVEDNPGLVT